MTALTAGIKANNIDSIDSAAPAKMFFPIAASAVIYPGATVALNAAGYAVAASAAYGQVTLGVYAGSTTASNTGGANGAFLIAVSRGVWQRSLSTGNDLLTIVDVGKPCFVVDDNVVARTSAGGTRPFAGRVAAFDELGNVYVEIGTEYSVDPSVDDVLLTVGAGSLAAQQYNFVVLGSTGVVAQSVEGGAALGVLQNAPAAAGVAIVRRRGRSLVNASATIAAGAKVASTSAGLSKAAVATSVSSTTVVGSYCMGDAITAGAASATHIIDVLPQGVQPTTAA